MSENNMKFFVIQDNLDRIFLVRPESKGWSGKVIASIEADGPKTTVQRFVPAQRDLCGSFKALHGGVPDEARNIMISYEIDAALSRLTGRFDGLTGMAAYDDRPKRQREGEANLQVSNPAAPLNFGGRKMTETMKKFKLPFRYEDLHIGVYDAEDNLVTMVIDESNFSLPESGKLIADALNFYYANKREQSERKGEKE